MKNDEPYGWRTCAWCGKDCLKRFSELGDHEVKNCCVVCLPRLTREHPIPDGTWVFYYQRGQVLDVRLGQVLARKLYDYGWRYEVKSWHEERVFNLELFEVGLFSVERMWS